MLQASLEDTEGLLGHRQDGNMNSHTHRVGTRWTPATIVLNPTWTTMTKHYGPNVTVGTRLTGERLHGTPAPMLKGLHLPGMV